MAAESPQCEAWGVAGLVANSPVALRFAWPGRHEIFISSSF